MRLASMFFIYAGLTCVAMATSYIPISLKKQLGDTSLVVHGIISGKQVKDANSLGNKGKVYSRLVTSIQINPIQTMSLGPRVQDHKTPGPIQFLVPGGELKNITEEVLSSPKFELGQEVVVLLRTVDEVNFWPANLGMAKFSVNQGSVVWDMYPEDKNLSNIALPIFLKKIENQAKKKFLQIQAPAQASHKVVPVAIPADPRQHPEASDVAEQAGLKKEDAVDASNDWGVGLKALILLIVIFTAFIVRKILQRGGKE